MQLLSEIIIRSSSSHAAIQLLQGDLTALPKEYPADILVVSAFPGDYTPLPGSLMYALHERGIEVGDLAKDKAVDLVEQLGCWLSKPLGPTLQAQFNFKQILCFEPSRESGAPETVVGNIFRCLNNFVFDAGNNVVAMPVLASGRQKVPVEKMLPAMLEACIFWMDSGIPLHAIRLIIHSDEHAAVALPIFEQARKEYEGAHVGPSPVSPPADRPDPSPSRSPTTAPSPAPDRPASVLPSAVPIAPSSQPTPPVSIAPTAPAAAPKAPSANNRDYDFFISYSHVQSEQVAQLVRALKEKDSSLNIFYDRSSIPTGSLWIRQLSDAIQRSKSVVCILSPQYRCSDACWDEFQCAKVKEFRTKQSVIKTINFLNDPDMPLIMAVYSYIDCTEGDVDKLKEAVGQLF